MKLYNSFSQKLETLDIAKKISLYVCGITPYDTTHLGHAFTFLIYDVLVRYLRFLGRDVTYVQNVTDVDDDILIRAKSLNINWKKLATKETKKHLKNMDRLNTLKPEHFPKASTQITSMIQIIKVLLKKGLAYETNGSVYFEVKKDRNFGKLSKLGYRAMLEIANERGNFPLDPNKEYPLDFVLWQRSKHTAGWSSAEKFVEPYWNSPWGKGRPGWHIECSAMGMKYLGPTITIHGGGSDLMFPHHEAEIAQSENYTGKKFVKIWMHTAMVFCEGKKMSKSLGNMVFISDLLKKYSPNTIRILLLSHHWHTPWNYDEEELNEAVKTAQVLEKSTSKSTGLTSQQAKRSLSQFFKALDENLDTPKALKILVNLAKMRGQRSSGLITICGQILGLKF
ncbi:cysteine--tRNA ligase [Candidatus Curtissbacteria bacterium RBG_13_40_7]|uniref:Cysteine--tRNA ligase n=1 Tax=Candidatus Curtissbacteria bacterium RBG_13_40_7 TaxID=1797706 RepID=A0A1F5FWU9_9BACT|nr:MAG: cysteine--tRNA ligase [Candidatus Curtissbacteria bacterium RBG_13_40_7]